VYSKHPTPVLVFVFALLAGLGCGKAVTTYKVKGTVTYKEKALTTGVVAFHHTDAKSPLVTGDIHPDGTFELTTIKPGDGDAAGEYRVTVTSMTPGHGVEGVDQDYRPPQPLIPLKYMRLVETPLTATVKPQDDNVIMLSLTP
jgi:hypothetical protein